MTWAEHSSHLANVVLCLRGPHKDAVMETLKRQRKSGRKRKVKHKMSTIKERKTFARLLVMLLPLSWKLPVPSGTFEEGRWLAIGWKVFEVSLILACKGFWKPMVWKLGHVVLRIGQVICVQEETELLEDI